MDFETRAIHAGQEPDPATGSVIVPIYQTSTYVQEEVGKNKGYDYSRVANPTRTALETCLASLEGAEHGVAYSAGLCATTTLMHLLNPGDRVVLIADVYGGVYRMTSQIYEPKGYSFEYVTADEFNTNLAAHCDERTRMIWVETPSNPVLNVVDIRTAAEASFSRPIAAIRSPLMPTSPWNHGAPLPSTIRPLTISRSKSGGCARSVASESSTRLRTAIRTGMFETHRCMAV